MKILDLGRKAYLETWELQKSLVEERARDAIEDTLILVEHDPIYTIGRSGGTRAPGTLVVPGLGSAQVIEVERGGKLTFHGPGQLVGYPIFKLQNQDLRGFLRSMERALIDAIRAETKLDARPVPASMDLEPGQLGTGVWIGNRKLASIGIAVRKWVSYHGFALNFSTDLRWFAAVDPCGFSGDVMTTLAAAAPSADPARVRDRISANLRNVSESFLGESPAVLTNLT